MGSLGPHSSANAPRQEFTGHCYPSPVTHSSLAAQGLSLTCSLSHTHTSASHSTPLLQSGDPLAVLCPWGHADRPTQPICACDLKPRSPQVKGGYINTLCALPGGGACSVPGAACGRMGLSFSSISTWLKGPKVCARPQCPSITRPLTPHPMVPSPAEH